jgi:hypothetical protein
MVVSGMRWTANQMSLQLEPLNQIKIKAAIVRRLRPMPPRELPRPFTNSRNGPSDPEVFHHFG